MVAKEVLVVAEHEKQVACPKNHDEFHEGDDGGVACHGAHHYLISLAAEAHALNPTDEVAAVLCGEDIECHHHGP